MAKTLKIRIRTETPIGWAADGRHTKVMAVDENGVETMLDGVLSVQWIEWRCLGRQNRCTATITVRDPQIDAEAFASVETVSAVAQLQAENDELRQTIAALKGADPSIIAQRVALELKNLGDHVARSR
jgi:hypothetical protein